MAVLVTTRQLLELGEILSAQIVCNCGAKVAFSLSDGTCT